MHQLELESSNTSKESYSVTETLEYLFGKGYFLPFTLPILYKGENERFQKYCNKHQKLVITFKLAEAFDKFNKQIENILIRQCSQSRMITTFINASTRRDMENSLIMNEIGLMDEFEETRLKHKLVQQYNLNSTNNKNENNIDAEETSLISRSKFAGPSFAPSVSLRGASVGLSSLPHFGAGGTSQLSSYRTTESLIKRSNSQIDGNSSQHSGSDNSQTNATHESSFLDDKTGLLYPTIFIDKYPSWLANITQKHIEFLEMVLNCPSQTVKDGLPKDFEFYLNFKLLDPMVKKWKMKSNYYYVYLIASMPYRVLYHCNINKYFETNRNVRIENRSNIKFDEEFRKRQLKRERSVYGAVTSFAGTNTNTNEAIMYRNNVKSRKESNVNDANNKQNSKQNNNENRTNYKRSKYLNQYETRSYNISYNVINRLTQGQLNKNAAKQNILAIHGIEITFEDFIIEIIQKSEANLLLDMKEMEPENIRKHEKKESEDIEKSATDTTTITNTLRQDSERQQDEEVAEKALAKDAYLTQLDSNCLCKIYLKIPHSTGDARLDRNIQIENNRKIDSFADIDRMNAKQNCYDKAFDVHNNGAFYKNENNDDNNPLINIIDDSDGANAVSMEEIGDFDINWNDFEICRFKFDMGFNTEKHNEVVICNLSDYRGLSYYNPWQHNNRNANFNMRIVVCCGRNRRITFSNIKLNITYVTHGSQMPKNEEFTLVSACEKLNMPLVKYILRNSDENQFNINGTDNIHRNAMHALCENPKIPVRFFNLLIKYSDIDLSLQNDDGYTPLDTLHNIQVCLLFLVFVCLFVFLTGQD